MPRESGAALVTEVLPPSLARIDATDPDAASWLGRRYRPRGDAHVRLNMVTTVTGSIAGEDGTSDTVTSPTDRLVLRAIRAAADVVVVGAGTARAERYVLPARARLAIVTSSGDLAGVRLTREGRPPALVLSSAGDAARVRARLGSAPVEHIVVPGTGPARPAGIVAALAALRLRRVVCEGGPTLATRFLESGALDEVCVTVAPTLSPAGTAFVSPTHPHATEVAGMLVDDRGFSYLRLKVRGAAVSATR